MTTTKSNLPALRFQDEQGINYPDWKERRLSDVLDYEQPTEFLVRNRDYDDSYKTPVLTAGKTFLLGYTNELTGIFIDKLPAIIFDDFTTAFKYVDFPFKAKSSAMKILIPKSKCVNMKFVYEAMQRVRFPLGEHKRYWISEYQRERISYPSKDEQQKIANFLSSVDTKIEQLGKKKALLEQYKKGMMQKLFSQETRFKGEQGNEYPDWKKLKLGDVSVIKTGASNRVDSGKTGKYTFFDRSQDIRASNKFLFDAEAVIIAGEGQDFIPKFFVGKFDLHQRSYAIMDFKNTHGKFVFYNLAYNKHYFLSKAVGSTVKSLRLPIFQKMPIYFPCLKEQQKIANFLSAIDKKIELVAEQLEQVRTFKKGLLQQMFI